MGTGRHIRWGLAWAMTGLLAFCRRSLAKVGLLSALLLLALPAAQAEVVVSEVRIAGQGSSLSALRYEEDSITGEKAPLLMVHGLTYSSHEFDVDYADYSLARFFARHGREVWLVDAAGYGRSEEVVDGFLPDSDYVAADLERVVRHILGQHPGLRSMDILGWSWGTVTSGRFAARHPGLVRRLVLYAPIVAGLGAARVSAPFNHNTYEGAVDDFQKRPDGSVDPGVTDPQVVNAYAAGCWRYDGERSPNGGRRDLLVGKERRLIPTARIKAPTLIIAGNSDPYVSMELCEEAYLDLGNPQSEIYIEQGAGHAMLLERDHYQVFRERVLRFIEQP